MKKKKKYLGLDKDILVKEYCENKLSCKEIGIKLSVGSHVIRNRLIEYGIELRRSIDSQKIILNREKISCTICGIYFQKKIHKSHYCSEKCRLKYRSIKEYGGGYSQKNCCICNAIFKPVTSRHKTCSASCKLLLDRQKANRFQKGYNKKNRKNPNYLFKRILLAFIRRCILNKQSASSIYINYNKQDFINHIEALFLPGMSWENYGKWHIDHKKPLCHFCFINADGSENIEQIKKANALDNLQPLWAIDNLRKNKKYDNSESK